MKNDKLWELVRKYNELSSLYSQIADDLTKTLQEMEDQDGRE